MTRLPFRALAALLLSAGAASAQQAPRKLEVADVQKVHATITYEIRTKEFTATEWMVFLPEPPELPSQRGVKVACDPPGRVVADRSLLGRKVRYVDRAVRHPAPGAGLKLRLDIEATLRSRKLVDLKPGEEPPRVAPLTASERKYYLAPSTHVDYDSKPVQTWLAEKGLRRGPAEDPVKFAKRILEVVRDDFTYHYDAYEEKRASVACKSGKTDCAGMSYLFVAAMRSGGVPARLIVGRMALPRKPGSTPAQTSYDRPHVRAEFFVDGIGWVPADPSYAHASKGRPVTDFIGNDPGDLIVLHVDVDLKLPFPDKVREAQFIQIEPFYWTKGQGNFDGYFGPSGWELKATPIEK